MTYYRNGCKWCGGHGCLVCDQARTQAYIGTREIALVKAFLQRMIDEHIIAPESMKIAENSDYVRLVNLAIKHGMRLEREDAASGKTPVATGSRFDVIEWEDKTDE